MSFNNEAASFETWTFSTKKSAFGWKWCYVKLIVRHLSWNESNNLRGGMKLISRESWFESLLLWKFYSTSFLNVRSKVFHIFGMFGSLSSEELELCHIKSITVRFKQRTKIKWRSGSTDWGPSLWNVITIIKPLQNVGITMESMECYKQTLFLSDLLNPNMTSFSCHVKLHWLEGTFSIF